MSGSTHDGGEDGAGGIVTGEPGLAHAGAVINNEGGDVVIHVCRETVGLMSKVLVMLFIVSPHLCTVPVQILKVRKKKKTLKSVVCF